MKNIFSFLLLVGFLASCTIKANVHLISGFSINEIDKSRVSAIKMADQDGSQIDFRILRKKSKQVLRLVFDRLEQNNVKFYSWPRINIVDHYEHESHRHEGVIWGDTVFYRYSVNFQKKSIDYLTTINGLENYPRNPDIARVIIHYLDLYKPNIDYFSNIPGTGRSGNGHYVFTRILKNEAPHIESFALRQW